MVLKKKYVIGLDYGTDSVRAVLVDTENGEEIASHVHRFQRWAEGKFCDASINQFRQHPLDHIEGLEKTIISLTRNMNKDVAEIKAICIDSTGSSPLPLTRQGIPLALTKGFEKNKNAMMVLWKDHTSINEANEINELAINWGDENYTKYQGGIYSSEWFWAKILHVIREDEAVKINAHTWMEHCDYLTYLLADNKDLKTFKRSRSAAGTKAMWHESWNGLPSEKFLSILDPYLGKLRRNLYCKTYTSNEIAGNLNQEWADKLGLTTKIVIAVGTIDAYSGAIGAKINEHSLIRVMGTSSSDIIVSSQDIIRNIPIAGICGQVNGSVIPHLVGLNAGQSAFGDVLAWFIDILSWPIDNMVMTSSILTDKQKHDLQKEIDVNFIRKLTEQAENIPLSEAIPIALDWINGRRTPYANQELKSAVKDISLGTKAPHIFKALINAICFGSKLIVDKFEAEGIIINEVIGIGGIARKSPFIMQTLANVLNKPIKIVQSDQVPALGSAIYAAVAAGIYDNVIEASIIIGSDYESEYIPEDDKIIEYKELLKSYVELGEFVENSFKINSKYKNKAKKEVAA